jgi:hypothetical protein
MPEPWAQAFEAEVEGMVRNTLARPGGDLRRDARRLKPRAVVVAALAGSILAGCSSGAPNASGVGSLSQTAPPPPPASASLPAASISAPSAPSSTAPTGNVSPICDPWITTDTVESIVGVAATALDAYNFLNEGQPVDCEWTFADGSELDLWALDQPEYGQISDYVGADGTRTGGIDYVDGLGVIAFFDAQEGLPSSLNWFPDQVIQLELSATPGLPSQVIANHKLLAVAKKVTIPSPLPAKP